MESLLCRQDASTAIVKGCQLQGILIGFGTGIYEKQLVILVPGHLAKSERKGALQGILYRIAVETQAGDLRGDSLDIMGMCMAYADDSMAAIEIEIFRTLFIPDVTTLATVYGDIEQWIYVK